MMDMFYSAGLPPEWLTQYFQERLVTSRANGNASSGSSEYYKCLLCPQQFSLLQDCLKHELIYHSMGKKRREGRLRKKLNRIFRTFNAYEEQSSRLELCNELSKCAPGDELNSVFKTHCLYPSEIEHIYFRIFMCLARELSSIRSIAIFPFGSIINKLALKGSDINFYIELNPPSLLHEFSPYETKEDIYNKINYHLYHSSCFTNVTIIRNKRIPVIKCKHLPTGFNIDISIGCPNNVHNSHFVRDVVQLDNRLHELMIFLKIWARHLLLIEDNNMTNYCLIILIVFYLQQPQRRYDAPLTSVMGLQTLVDPVMVRGANYAYNIDLNGSTLPSYITTSMLIRGFFAFYKRFDFENCIIAPHLGVAVPIDRFKSGEFQYDAYDNQQRIASILNYIHPEPLPVGRCMCVQDPFCLNVNIASSMSPSHLKYFRKCLYHSHHVCNDPSITTDAQLYKALLYGIVEEIARFVDMDNCVGEISCSNDATALSYSFTPTRGEVRALLIHNHLDDDALFRLWANHYIDAVIEIITLVYMIDMQIASPIHGLPNKLQTKEDAQHTRTWTLNTNVDMWTGRLHRRFKSKTFMKYQLEQTDNFCQDRSRNPAYVVELSGFLTITSTANYKSIDLVVTQSKETTSGLWTKKEPLRKFFTMFKCSMQNFNLRERLYEKKAAARRRYY